MELIEEISTAKKNHAIGVFIDLSIQYTMEYKLLHQKLPFEKEAIDKY